MNRYRLAIALLLAVAVGLIALTLMPAKKTAPADGSQTARAQETASGAARAAKPAAARGDARAASRADRKPPPAAAADERPEAAETPAAAAMRAPAASERQTTRERAVASWEAMIDRVIAEADMPAAEQAKRVKEAFDSLDKQDQMDGIRRSLNLFQNEQFPALYDILFDKTEDPEILDAIFSDALNRPEELKNPLMKELVKDKEHPCFFESARILDVIGELEVKPAPTASP